MLWLFLIIFCLIIFLSSTFFYSPIVSKKKFCITFLSISFSALLIYFFKGNKEIFVFESSVNKEIKNLASDPKSLMEINPQKIIFFLESKLRENPKDLEGWKLLARACLMTGHIQKAEVHFTKALKYFPLNESLIYEYAVLKRNTDQFHGALKLLRKVDIKKTKNKELIFFYFDILKETENSNVLDKKIVELENNNNIDPSEKKRILKKLKLN